MKLIGDVQPHLHEEIPLWNLGFIHLGNKWLKLV